MTLLYSNPIPPFKPNLTTVNIAATSSSGNVALTVTQPADEVRIYNAGSVPVFITFGVDNTVVATAAAGIPIPPGVVELFRRDLTWLYVAAITASSTATVYFTSGDGQ